MNIKDYLAETNETQASFADKLGVKQGMVSHWICGRNVITAEKAREVEVITDGVVTRYELRPDIFDKPRNAR